jgi:hypothetical protein
MIKGYFTMTQDARQIQPSRWFLMQLLGVTGIAAENGELKDVQLGCRVQMWQGNDTRKLHAQGD